MPRNRSDREMGVSRPGWDRWQRLYDDPVCRHVPEFGRTGKEGVTVRHLMTHAGGLTDPVREVVPFDDAIAAVCAAPLVAGWVPGARGVPSTDDQQDPLVGAPRRCAEGRRGCAAAVRPAAPPAMDVRGVPDRSDADGAACHQAAVPLTPPSAAWIVQAA